MNESEQVLKLLGEKSRVNLVTAVFVSYNATGAVVDIGTSRLTAAFGSPYLPEVGEAVLVWFVDGFPYVMGPTTPRPSTGTVTAVASNRVTLSTPVGSVGPLPYVGSAPVVGQTMRIMWHGGGLAMTATDSVLPTPVAPPPGSGPTQHVDEFRAVQAGTWNTGGGDSATSFLNSEVWASNTTIGLWFYGTKIGDTIPAGAYIQRVQLYVSARQIQGAQPRFTTHGYAAAPGAPALSGGVQIGVANNAWVDLPTTFGDALRWGAGQYGIGARHGGYNIFKSLSDPLSGALRITSTY